MKITDYKMIQKDEHDHLAYSWKIFKEVIVEIENAKTDREIQQKLIEMGWTPPKESTCEGK